MVCATRKKRIRKNRDRVRTNVAFPDNWLTGSILVLAFTIAAILHVRGKLAVVQLGYQLSEATREHKQLLADQRKLQVEVATLRNPRRLRKIATGELGLHEPAPAQILRGENGGGGKLAMGVARER